MPGFLFHRPSGDHRLSPALPLIAPDDLVQAGDQVEPAESLVRARTFMKSAEEEVPNLFRTLHWLQSSGGCGFCHESNDDSNGNWTITKPNIPDRWFRHANFHHDAHRTLKCVECHSISGSSDDILQGDDAPPEIYKSSSTGDILMPRIALCKSCDGIAPVKGIVSTALRQTVWNVMCIINVTLKNRE